MLILFALGIMSLLWMAIVTAIIFLQKVLPFGQRLTWVLAVVFVATGIWVAAAPGSVPGLVDPTNAPAMQMGGSDGGSMQNDGMKSGGSTGGGGMKDSSMQSGGMERGGSTGGGGMKDSSMRNDSMERGSSHGKSGSMQESGMKDDGMQAGR
jgi:hypothetical protein